MSRYKWVFNPEVKDSRDDNWRLCDVGILPDGTLHNTRGYPEDLVRAAVEAADARRHERRSQAAKQAAETRARRQEKRVYEAARRIVERRGIPPQRHCSICGRGLDDPASIARAIGSECWGRVLSVVERLQERRLWPARIQA